MFGFHFLYNGRKWGHIVCNYLCQSWFITQSPDLFTGFNSFHLKPVRSPSVHVEHMKFRNELNLSSD